MNLASNFFKPFQSPSETLYKLYFDFGYTLTVTEAAAALDVKERYLMDTFSDKFNYVLVPAGATQCFKAKIEECQEKLSSKDLQENERIAIQKDLNRYRFLIKKRVFINYDSFITFLTRNLYIDYKYVAIRLTSAEKQKLSQEQLNEVVETVLKRFDFEDTERRLVSPDEAVKVLKRPVLSGASVKVEYLKIEHSHYLRKTVHDMQLHRFLDRYYSNDRYSIRGLGDEREVVRYHIRIDQAYEDIDASFLVPNCDSNKRKAIKKAVIKEIKVYREKLEEERKKKSKSKPQEEK